MQCLHYVAMWADADGCLKITCRFGAGQILAVVFEYSISDSKNMLEEAAVYGRFLKQP